VVTLAFGTSPVESRLRYRFSSLRILVCLESPQTVAGKVPRLCHHLSCRSPLQFIAAPSSFHLTLQLNVLSDEGKEGNVVLVCAMRLEV